MRLHSLEGDILSDWERNGEEEVEVIFPPGHIHFAVFSSRLPLDITPIIPPFTIIYVA